MRANVDGLTPEELHATRQTWWTGEFDAFLLTAFPGGLPARVLDVGCGIGTLEGRLGARAGTAARFVGVDVDVPRLLQACRRGEEDAPSAAAFLGADGARLPFPDGTFGASTAILTLQHVPDPVRILAEMRRTTEPGGLVVAVEPDNLGQRLYLPRPDDGMDRALAAFWGRVRESRLPADIAVGPRLPGLFERAGLSAPALRGYLVVRASESETGRFLALTTERILRLASAHGVREAAETAALLEAVGTLRLPDGATIRTVATVPLFLACATV